MPVSNKIIKEDLDAITSYNIDWGRFNGKTVLITGANGFLPAYMVETLLHLNETFQDFNVTVLALIRNKTKAEKRFADYLLDKHLIFLEQDVIDEIIIEERVDFIVHAASQASPKYYGTDPVGTLSANVLGTINLMKLAVEKNVESFLYFSSGEVYGEVDSAKMPVKEDSCGFLDPTIVRSCYGESKRMGENICVSYHHQYDVPAKIVRPFHTYGPGMSLDDGRVFADFVKNILDGNNIIMRSNGMAKRAFCYLSDAVIAYFIVLLSSNSGIAYNIGNPQQEFSILQLANILQEMYKTKGIQVVQYNSLELSGDHLVSSIFRSSPNIDKIRQLGWCPKITVQEGFKRTIESFQ